MSPLLKSTCPLPSAPNHPARQPRPNVTVELIELPFGIPRSEVVSPSPKHGIQCCDDLLHVFPAVPRFGQLMHAFPDSLRGFRRRPPLHKVHARVPLYAPLLSNRAAQKHKALLPTSQVHHPRLLRM